MNRRLGLILLSITFITSLASGDEMNSLAPSSIEAKSNSYLVAKRKKSKSKKAKKRRRRKSRKGGSELVVALRLAKQGKYQEASVKLFQLAHSPRFRDKRMQIKYILGLMLYQMKMYQISAFQFISVVKQGNNKYLKQSLEKLSLAADALGDNTLLNYAISRVEIKDFPRVHRDKLYFRIGEFQMRNLRFKDAVRSLGRVSHTSPLFGRAKYLQGLAYAENKNSRKAIVSFEDLISSRKSQPVTDPSRVAALIGRARVYYQSQKWEKAMEAYREVPRDTELWHDTLFESSWAMLRSGRFRSALSNFQSLHSPFYESFYLPESLLLRAIVYLYICKYDEMDKVLNLYSKIYKPVYVRVKGYLKSERDPVVYFNDTIRLLKDFKIHGEDLDKTKHRLPFIVGRHLIKEGDFQRSYKYIKNLLQERKRIKAMPGTWKRSAIGKYANRVLQTRLIKARKKAGGQLRTHMEILKTNLFDLFEQEGFIRYEMINGKKEQIKKKVAGKDLPTTQIDDDTKRDFYIQNGFEYWPFQGEYWLDELGNYHYVGTQSCD